MNPTNAHPRILVDLLFYTGTKGGMESYVRSLYSEIRAFAPDAEFVGLASSELFARGAPWFPGELIASGISGESRGTWAWGELTAVGRHASQIAADVIHCPANLGPWRATAALPWQSSVPVVVTTHDMLPFRNPEYVPGPYAPVLRALMKGAAQNARRIITISEASKRDILRYIPSADGSIDVIPLAGSVPRGVAAVSPRTAPAAPADSSAMPSAASAHAAPLTRRPDLLLALGNRLPHKNFDGLLRALALIDPAARPQLVVTGSHSDDPLAALVADLQLASWVTLRGWIPDDTLETLYAEATAIVVPSLFEGFGLPVLDAMSRGCPVLCSDIPVLREVADDAALYFDPRSPASIATAVTSALASADKLATLAAAGHRRAAGFSWTRTAELTAQSLLRAAK